MKNFFAVILTLSILIYCSGCIPGGDRPFYHPYTKWVSNDPNVFFVIESGDEDYFYGEMIVDNKVESIIVLFHHYTTNVSFDKADSYDDNEDGVVTLFRGSCKYSDSLEKLVIKIKKESDTVFNGQYDTITFIREDYGGNE